MKRSAQKTAREACSRPARSNHGPVGLDQVVWIHLCVGDLVRGTFSPSSDEPNTSSNGQEDGGSRHRRRH
eukprot:385120-Rhodomonas_salina.2